MVNPYGYCQSCDYEFIEPNVGHNGVKKKCPKCGSTSRRYELEVKDSVILTEISSVKLDAMLEGTPEFEAQFDIEKQVSGRTIIECSDNVRRNIIEHFNKNPRDLKILDRRRFEELVAELFDGFGYDVELTKQTHDGGKDIIAVKKDIVEVKYLIECKRPDPGGYVSINPVRELYGVKTNEKATKAVLATTAHFSKDAKLFVENIRWELELKEFEDLKEWIRLYLEVNR
jgi:HJR/Mrr/RecB family endonuclease